MVYDYVGAYKELIKDDTPIAVGDLANAIKKLKLVTFSSKPNIFGSAYYVSDPSITHDIYQIINAGEFTPTSFPYTISAGTYVEGDYIIHGSSTEGETEVINKQEKTITAGTSSIEVLPDTDYLLSKVTVNPTPTEILNVTPSTEEQIFTPTKGKHFSQVIIAAAPENISAEVAAQPAMVAQIKENLVGKETGANATPETILEGYSAYVGQKLVTGTYKPGMIDPSAFGYTKMATGVALVSSTGSLTIGHNLGERAKKIICYKVDPTPITPNSSVYNSEITSFIFDFNEVNGTETASKHYYGGTATWNLAKTLTGFSAYVEYSDITTTKTIFRNYGANEINNGDLSPVFSAGVNYVWIAFI